MSRLLVTGMFVFLLLTMISNVSLAQNGEDDLEHTSDTLEKVKELVEEKKAILVDVRSLVEWEDGHVEGAAFLPWRDLQDKPDEAKIREAIPKGMIVYTYCAVGYRALRAGKVIAKYKYEVRPLKPGYEELIKAGFEKAKK